MYYKDQTEFDKVKNWKRENFERKLNNPWIKFLKYSGTARLYKDGDCIGALLRWYHPFSWIFIVLFLVSSIFMEETFPSLMKENFTLSPYWKDRKIEWV